jgi:ribosome biogenesis GTPase / thiamine phosphate phosphatase
MDEIQITTLKDLGFDGFHKSEHIVARVVAEYKEAYRVRSLNGEFLAKITGKQLFLAAKREDYPAVGDFVMIDELSGKKAVIRYVLPRKTVLKKKYSDKEDNQLIATNIDTAFIVGSPDRDFNLNRFERYLVLSKDGGIKSAIIINKTDIISKAELDAKILEIKERFREVDILLTSTVTEMGLGELEKYIQRSKTYCFLGSSGVGKSSLINKLLGKDEIKTNEINKFTGRGKHTTSSREMHFLKNGGIVIDNPGTREVGLTDIHMGINEVFDEIVTLSNNCKFSDCTHTIEFGCAVLESVEKGTLDKDKYNNYLKLRKESEYYEMTDYEKRTKDKRFGKFIKKAQIMLKNEEL